MAILLKALSTSLTDLYSGLICKDHIFKLLLIQNLFITHNLFFLLGLLLWSFHFACSLHQKRCQCSLWLSSTQCLYSRSLLIHSTSFTLAVIHSMSFTLAVIHSMSLTLAVIHSMSFTQGRCSSTPSHLYLLKRHEVMIYIFCFRLHKAGKKRRCFSHW